MWKIFRLLFLQNLFLQHVFGVIYFFTISQSRLSRKSSGSNITEIQPFCRVRDCVIENLIREIRHPVYEAFSRDVQDENLRKTVTKLQDYGKSHRMSFCWNRDSYFEPSASQVTAYHTICFTILSVIIQINMSNMYKNPADGYLIV